LGIFGEDDSSIPLEEVQGFQKALEARQIEHTITVYPGVGHAFVHYDTIMQAGPAQAAWNQMLNFFQTTLGD
jgi:carboxymethylenebutenolidase